MALYRKLLRIVGIFAFITLLLSFISINLDQRSEIQKLNDLNWKDNWTANWTVQEEIEIVSEIEDLFGGIEENINMKIMVVSGISVSFEGRRSCFRETMKGFDFTNYFFLVGSQIANIDDTGRKNDIEVEAMKHGDIVLYPGIDKRMMLSDKVLWGFRYAVDNFNFDILLKTDDDSFINMYQVKKKLKEMQVEKDKPWFAGLFRGPMDSEREYKSISRNFKCPAPFQFPMFFPAGAGYFLSRPSVKAIVALHDFSKRAPCQAEDRYVGRLYELTNTTFSNPIDTRMMGSIYCVWDDKKEDGDVAGCLVAQRKDDKECKKTLALLDYVNKHNNSTVTEELACVPAVSAGIKLAGKIESAKNYVPGKGFSVKSSDLSEETRLENEGRINLIV